MSELKTYTFWQLVKAFHIEIPIVQRDYAQGRTDSKSTEIRTQFVDDLRQALISTDDSSIELNFVYGKVEKNIFIPIDGQQRLTTLFLLHWYVGVRVGKWLCNIVFTYKTRISAQAFCEALTKSRSPFDTNDTSKQSKSALSGMITNASWFYLTWKKDPTVQAILTMLDAIHEKFKDDDCNKIWEKLLSETPKTISFKFLDLEEFKLTDELYLKMNARGKPLSDFEYFKTWLIGQIDNCKYKGQTADLTKFENTWCEPIEQDWTFKMDSTWTDFIWRNRSENADSKSTETALFDKTGIHFIKNIAFICFFNRNIKKTEKVYETVYTNYLSKHETAFLGTIYKECFVDLKSYDLLLNAFNILSIHLKSSTDVAFFPTEWKDENANFIKKTFNESDFEHRSYLFAIIQFYYEDIKRENFDDWFRVVRNLIKNTAINADNFHNILKSIELLARSEDVQRDLESTSGFDKSQLDEEKLKLDLFQKDPQWKEAIIDAENHAFFKGRIHFLLDEAIKSDLELFTQRKIVAKKLFNAKGLAIGKETNLFGRVLLALGLDFDLKGTWNLRELWLGGRSNQYWKTLLNEPYYCPFILKAIDSLKNSHFEKYKETFEELCTVLSEEPNIPFWRKVLISNPALFQHYSHYGRIKKDWRGINLYESEKFNPKTNAILIENNRNEIITEFCKNGFNLVDTNCKKCDYFYAGDKIILQKENSTLKLTFDINAITVNDDNTKKYDFTKIKIDELKKDFPDYFDSFI